MRFGYGDCSNPLAESVHLVETIVHQQMECLLIRATEIAELHGNDSVTHEEILFLMRKDRVKLCRLLKWLEIKDSRSNFSVAVSEEEVSESLDEEKPKSYKKTRVDKCLIYLRALDTNGELSNILEDDQIYDQVKHERLVRQDMMSLSLDQAQYFEYVEARKKNFTGKFQDEKFVEWLYRNEVTDLRPTELAIELISYLAKETVATIVDLCLLVKQDQKLDPLERLQPPLLCNTEYPSIQLISYDPSSSTTLGDRQAATNSNLSTTSSSSPSQPNTTQVSSEPSTSQSVISDTPKHNKTEKKPTLNNPRAISPHDIIEVFRRFYQQPNPFSCLGFSNFDEVKMRLLCL